MRVNEKLLIDFLLAQKKHIREKTLDQMELHYAEKVVSDLERICGIGLGDYTLKFYCENCGWIGDKPGRKNRNEVYLIEESAGEGDDVFFCPRCEKFKIQERTPAL